jgi:hypothetical protein
MMVIRAAPMTDHRCTIPHVALLIERQAYKSVRPRPPLYHSPCRASYRTPGLQVGETRFVRFSLAGRHTQTLANPDVGEGLLDEIRCGLHELRKCSLLVAIGFCARKK